MTANAPINIERAATMFSESLCRTGTITQFDIPFVAQRVDGLLCALLERVEAQTIERCELYEDGTLHDIKRLYAPKSDKEEGK